MAGHASGHGWRGFSELGRLAQHVPVLDVVGGGRPAPLPPAAQEILTKIVAQQGSWTDGEKKWSAINNATKR